MSRDGQSFANMFLCILDGVRCLHLWFYSQVLLISARNALLSRLMLRGGAAPETRARFCQLAFGRFANPATVTQVRGLLVDWADWADWSSQTQGWDALVLKTAQQVM